MTATNIPGITSVNPATGETVGEYPLHTEQEIGARLDAARRAQLALREQSFAQRAELLRKIGRALTDAREELAQTITAEMGKVLAESRAEVDKSVWACEYYAEHGAQQLGAEPIATDWTDSYVQFPPLGVVLAIMPWNYPIWQVMRAAAPAWMAGNTVVLKHASNVSGSALALERVVRAAAGELSPLEVVLVPGRRAAALIADDRIAAVTLTGSEAVGIQVAQACATVLKKSVLELGGSDPFIVLADADIDAAAQAAVKARFVNAGQSCIAGKRFIVVEQVADAFADAFVAHTRALRVGDPLADGVDIGPMARRDLRDELADQVVRGLERGARVITGGEHPDGPGAFFTPTIVDGVTEGTVLALEETFGPAAAIMRAPGEDAALALANASPYGLSSSLWTGDLDRARRLAPRIEAGAVFVNVQSASDPRMPFGGVKRSGWGRELGPFGIREFVNVQGVTIAPQIKS